MYSKESILIVFAKKPELGKVKTRLCPPLSSRQARQVAALLIRQTVENVINYWPGDVELSVWPDSNDELFDGLLRQYNIEINTQSSGDLGDKMRVAMTQKVNMGHNVLILGADVPHCSENILCTAYEALQAGKNVIGPTIDGGYYCIGVNNPKTSMFENVQWGGKMAYVQTLTSCADAGINFDVILPKINDLDTFEDLHDISKQLLELREFIDDKNN